MQFCPKCGVNRADVAALARCPRCGGPGANALAELATGAGVPAPPSVSIPPMMYPPLGPSWYPPPPVAPIQPRPFKIAFGVARTLLAAWLMLSWLPSKRPMSEAEQVTYAAAQLARGNIDVVNEWRLKPKAYVYGYLIAAGLGIWGVAGIVRGATYRPKVKPR